MLKKQTLFCALALAALPMLTLPAAGDLELGWDSPQTLRTPTRERQCLNGLWRFFPISQEGPLSDRAPERGTGWGYLKVPGVWPQGNGPTNSIQPLLPPEQLETAAKWHTGWYRREFTVPKELSDRRAFLDVEQLHTRAAVFVDGAPAGELLFPGGELELTGLIRPGERQTLELRVNALPLSENHYQVMDGNNVTKVAAQVKNKGITGDVFLHLVPPVRVENTHFVTSVRDREITFDSGLAGLRPGKKYKLRAEIYDSEGKPAKTFDSGEFTAESLKDGRFRFSAGWENPALWDLHTPRNLYTGVMTLTEDGKPADVTLPERFGFREFRIEGRNYMLNGSPIHLRAYHLPNYSAFWMADKASKENSLEAFRRLRELGFNFSISRNYNFAEGETNYLRGHCEAADEFGHLHSMSLPHPWQFGDLTVAENADRFAKMSSYLIRKYWNHPSLILWVTNHNHGGAWGDQNPLRIGGEYKRADSEDEIKMKEPGRANFLAAQKRIAEVDPSRPTYSHASGSLGGHYSLNAYFNWAPKQERSDWLENFSETGRYPLSFVEWGLPHIASFSSYRWPEFIWRTEDVMTVWDAEYLAAEYGDSAAEWTPERLKLLDKLIALGSGKTRWGALSKIAGSLPGVIQIQADYFSDNLRAMRAWGIGLLLPWDDYANYEAIPGDFPPPENPGRWQNLNAPGLVPDYFNWGDYILTARRERFRLSPLGKAIQRWNQPVIAFIGGEAPFTSKEHVYLPGGTIAKQLVLLNDGREPLECEYETWIKGINARPARGKVTVGAGEKALIPVSLELPERTRPGRYEMAAKFTFPGGEPPQTDTFTLDVTPPALPREKGEVALYDPRGMTAKLFDRLGVPYRKVDAAAVPESSGVLVIGREALDPAGALPVLDAVRDGRNVLIFEQKPEVLNRLGFRINEYGLRRLFPRTPEHPALAGLDAGLLADWRGEGTLLAPYLDYDQFFCPSWQWNGFKNTRIWRCRNRGVLANALIEKPTVGNFTPIADGGFALQYAPLLEYREGKGRILFCQAEVTGRSLTDPAADQLAVNLVDYLRSAGPVETVRFAVLAGEPFRNSLKALRLTGEVSDPAGAGVIVAGPGLETYPDLTARIESGAKLLAFGLNAAEIRQLLPKLEGVEDRKDLPSQMADLDAPEFTGISNLDTGFQTRLDYTTVGGRELAAIGIGKGRAVFAAVTPQMLDYDALFRLRSSWRRRAFLVSQLLRNAGIGSESVLLERFRSAPAEKPWLDSHYLQTPISGDDPYRYYHW